MLLNYCFSFGSWGCVLVEIKFQQFLVYRLSRWVYMSDFTVRFSVAFFKSTDLLWPLKTHPAPISQSCGFSEAKVCQVILYCQIKILKENSQWVAKLNLEVARYTKGIQIVNRLRHSCLNVMKLESYGSICEMLK